MGGSKGVSGMTVAGILRDMQRNLKRRTASARTLAVYLMHQAEVCVLDTDIQPPTLCCQPGDTA
jgi:hypothetical protein